MVLISPTIVGTLSYPNFFRSHVLLEVGEPSKAVNPSSPLTSEPMLTTIPTSIHLTQPLNAIDSLCQRCVTLSTLPT